LTTIMAADATEVVRLLRRFRDLWHARIQDHGDFGLGPDPLRIIQCVLDLSDLSAPMWEEDIVPINTFRDTLKECYILETTTPYHTIQWIDKGDHLNPNGKPYKDFFEFVHHGDPSPYALLKDAVDGAVHLRAPQLHIDVISCAKNLMQLREMQHRLGIGDRQDAANYHGEMVTVLSKKIIAGILPLLDGRGYDNHTRHVAHEYSDTEESSDDDSPRANADMDVSGSVEDVSGSDEDEGDSSQTPPLNVRVDHDALELEVGRYASKFNSGHTQDGRNPNDEDSGSDEDEGGNGKPNQKARDSHTFSNKTNGSRR